MVERQRGGHATPLPIGRGLHQRLQSQIVQSAALSQSHNGSTGIEDPEIRPTRCKGGLLLPQFARVESRKDQQYRPDSDNRAAWPNLLHGNGSGVQASLSYTRNSQRKTALRLAA